MSHCLCKCNSIEFDNIGIYINTDELNYDTAKYLLDKFLQSNNIDDSKVDIAFCYPNQEDLLKYGLYNALEIVNWLNTYGLNRLNFYRNMWSIQGDKVGLTNYLVNTKSIAVFIGTVSDQDRVEFDYLCQNTCIPIIHLTQDFRVSPIWVGRPDVRDEFGFTPYYLDNLS